MKFKWSILLLSLLVSSSFAQTIVEIRDPIILSPTSATLQGDLISISSLSTNITDLYFGYAEYTDYGTALIDWPNIKNVTGSITPTLFSATVSNLLPETEYVVRAFASNDVDNVWSLASTNFWTPAETEPDYPYFKVYGIPAGVMAGAPQTFTVEAWFGATQLTAYTGTVFFSSQHAETDLPLSYTFTPADAGRHTFTNAATFNRIGRFNSLKVEDSLDAGMRGEQRDILAFAGYADTVENLAVWNYPWRSYTGEFHSVSVAAVDRNYNLATNYFGTITFSSSDTMAWLPPGGSGSYGFTAQDAGWKTFTNDFGFNTVGVHWLNVEDTGNILSNKQWDLIAMGEGTSTQATHLVVSGDRFMRTGEPNRIEIMAHNVYEQIVETFEGFVSFACSDPSAIYPTNYYFSTSDMGHVVLDNFITMQTPGMHTLGVTYDPNPSITGILDPIEVYEDNMYVGTNLFIEINPVAVVGQYLDVTITALDPDGFVLTNYTGDVMFESDDPGAFLPSSAIFTVTDQGQITLSNAVSWSSAGLRELRVYDIMNTNIATEADVEVFHGGATNTKNLAIFTRENPMFVGTSNSVMVVALDDFGRVNTNYQESITFSNSHSGTFVLNPASNVFDAGIAFLFDQFVPTIDGYQSLHVSQTGSTNINGEINVLVVGGDKRFVDARNGSDINDGLTPSSAWQSLAYAVQQIAQGQALVIAPGHYTNGISFFGATGPGAVTTFYGDRSKRFFGRYGDVRIQTTDESPGIDLSGQNDIVVAHVDVEYPDTALNATGVVIRTSNNITLFDCLVWNAVDKGVFIQDSPLTTLDRCRIEESGYGVYVSGSSPGLHIENCDIERNDLEGITLLSATGVNIFKSWISDNGGHGIYFLGSQGNIDNSWIEGNLEDGIYVESVGASALVNRSLLMANGGAGVRFMFADAGSEVLHSIALYNDAGVVAEGGQPVSVRNSIMYANVSNGLMADFGGVLSNSYNCVFGSATNWGGTAAMGTGDIEADPLFASVITDQEDFHLKSTTGRFSRDGWVVDGVSSPAIDTGDPSIAADNEPMPNGGIVNMGIYGGTREASLSPAPMTYDIIATAGPNGSIAPSGTVSVAHGSNATFNITPDAGHHILDVWINGTSIGSTNTYTFVNVTNNGMTIDAYFDINEYTLDVTSPHGTPVPAGITTNAWGTMISASIDNEVTGALVQYINQGWIGTGSAPTMGMSNAVSFTIDQNSTIDWLWSTNYWIDILSDPNGSVDVISDWYAAATNLTITATPTNGYSFTGWTGDIVTNANPLNITVDTPLTLTPNFALNQYDITATAGPNGSIAPSGTVSVAHGSNATFNITPDAGHHILDVWINGTSIGSTNTYTFVNVTNNGMTIEAYFDINEYSLDVTSPHGTPVPAGITTNAWGTIISASIDSEVTGSFEQYINQGWIGTGSAPTMGMSNAVSFTIDQNSTIDWLWSTNYWIDILSDPNGSVDATSDWYAAATNLMITATPTNGYSFTGWTGDIVTNANPLNITVDTPLTLTPNFALNQYDITATAGPNGSIAPSGTVSVAHGSNATFNITPDAGHHILDVWINGTSIGSTNTYTFVNVTNNGMTIDAYFDINEYTLTYLAATGGIISGSETQTVAYGNNGLLVEATPDAGYSFSQWDDGLMTAQRQDMAVTNDLTATALFTLNQHTLNVISDHGAPSPAVGSNIYNWGSSVMATVDLVEAIGTTRYINTGWTGTGSVPASGTTNSITFTLTTDSSLTWNWLTEYRLTVGTPTNGSVDTSSQWVQGGNTVALTATPNTGYSFNGWLGDVPVADINANPLSLTMDQARSIVPAFTLDEGAISVEINYAADVSGARWRLTSGPDTNWKNSGDVVAALPTTGSPYSITFEAIPYYDTPADITNINVTAGTQTDLSVYYAATMVQIPAGTFNMGTTATSSGHPVELSSFMMDVRPVTIAQFMEFANATSVPMPIPPIWNGNTNLTWLTLNPQLPMVNVTWNQAKAYADWVGKRLPTEAEFEYAMRSGLPNSLYPSGNTMTTANANYDNSVGQPTPAGTYAATSFGLLDIVGNVWEWCGDWYAFVPDGGTTVTDPQGPATGTYKSIRGGSFITRSSRLQTPWRFYYTPDTRSTDLGFRCVTPMAATPAPASEPVPTWWVEWNFGAGSGNEADTTFSAEQDSDQDGMTDGDEFAGGYDPNNADSVLKVAANLAAATEATITWQSIANKTYSIERSAQAEGFQPIASGIKATPPFNAFMDTPEGNGPWFYRVVVEQ